MSTPIAVSKAVAKILWPGPPEHDHHPWRKAVSLVVMSILAVGTFHITAAKGMLDRFGIHGFATTQNVSQVEIKTNSILFALYAPQVRAKVRERCDAASADEREKINTELNHILNEYKNATGFNFAPMPRCGEV